ncbi:MAG: hypothetical protein QXQ11_06785 [Candidatus Bathyarchaeia archaeon]
MKLIKLLGKRIGILDTRYEAFGIKVSVINEGLENISVSSDLTFYVNGHSVAPQNFLDCDMIPPGLFGICELNGKQLGRNNVTIVGPTNTVEAMAYCFTYY